MTKPTNLGAKTLLVLLGLFAISVSDLFAQSVTVQATGTVLEPMTIGEANLGFNNIFPGVVKKLDYTHPNAANFAIDGEPGKQITADFTLPSSLTHTGGNIQTLSVSFGTSASGYSTGRDVSAATTHDPTTSLTTILGPTEGYLNIWLGGQVDPTIVQEKGDYTGDINLDVAYTGN